MWATSTLVLIYCERYACFRITLCDWNCFTSSAIDIFHFFLQLHKDWDQCLCWNEECLHQTASFQHLWNADDRVYFLLDWIEWTIIHAIDLICSFTLWSWCSKQMMRFRKWYEHNVRSRFASTEFRVNEKTHLQILYHFEDRFRSLSTIIQIIIIYHVLDNKAS